MKISTLFYTIKQGFINIFRNKWFSLASIATIGACLFLFGLFYSVLMNFQNIVKTAQEGVCVTVLFDEGISQERIEEIGALIDKRPRRSSFLQMMHGTALRKSIFRAMRMDLPRTRLPILPAMKYT